MFKSWFPRNAFGGCLLHSNLFERLSTHVGFYYFQFTKALANFRFNSLEHQRYSLLPHNNFSVGSSKFFCTLFKLFELLNGNHGVLWGYKGPTHS